MIEVSQEGQNPEQLIRKYKRKIDKIRLLKELKKRAVHIKKSAKLKDMRKKAILCQRYKQKNNLV